MEAPTTSSGVTRGTAHRVDLLEGVVDVLARLGASDDELAGDED
jgi:hypothetical protein